MKEDESGEAVPTGETTDQVTDKETKKDKSENPAEAATEATSEGKDSKDASTTEEKKDGTSEKDAEAVDADKTNDDSGKEAEQEDQKEGDKNKDVKKDGEEKKLTWKGAWDAFVKVFKSPMVQIISFVLMVPAVSYLVYDFIIKPLSKKSKNTLERRDMFSEMASLLDNNF